MAQLYGVVPVLLDESTSMLTLATAHLPHEQRLRLAPEGRVVLPVTGARRRLRERDEGETPRHGVPLLPRGEERLLRQVADYSMPNVSDKVVCRGLQSDRSGISLQFR